MKIKISYFNNIRNFTPNMIPVSTAMFDPKWYHTKDGNCYLDKNNVINGMRIEYLHLPSSIYNMLEASDKGCSKNCPLPKDGNCEFMKQYYKYLSSIPFKNLHNHLNMIANQHQQLMHYTEEPIVVLIVHESPNTGCAERPVLVQYFKDNGVDLEEVE